MFELSVAFKKNEHFGFYIIINTIVVMYYFLLFLGFSACYAKMSYMTLGHSISFSSVLDQFKFHWTDLVKFQLLINV